ncbi:hypothetical protein C3L33_09184, partial [Rhododendron williamsianum]
MDPNAVKSTLSNLAFGNVMAAAARDYQKEVLAQQKAQTSTSMNQEVDFDDLMDDPELEKLHADRIAALKKEAEKRETLKKQGHGEYREISEGDFLGEVTGSDKVVCHFYHREFYRCKLSRESSSDEAMIQSEVDGDPSTNLGAGEIGTDNGQAFEVPLPEASRYQVYQARCRGQSHVLLSLLMLLSSLPNLESKLCLVSFCSELALTSKDGINFRKGVAIDRLVGFQDLGGKDDFTTKTLEALLLRKGILSEVKRDEEDEDGDYHGNRRRAVRSSAEVNSDSD